MEVYMRKKSLYREKEWLVYLPDTPIGPLKLYFTDRGLSALEFSRESASSALLPSAPPAHLQSRVEAVKQQLKAYFEGNPADFQELALDPLGTPFQRRVWRELCRIPWGEVISYRELAKRIGNPNACRAVGQANGRNPIPLLIPCHRVIAANGRLGGYNSGLDRKRWLLRHEGAM
jgi:methylated-DNA-[protein]-cysteine S-methyltransferase